PLLSEEILERRAIQAAQATEDIELERCADRSAVLLEDAFAAGHGEVGRHTLPREAPLDVSARKGVCTLDPIERTRPLDIERCDPQIAIVLERKLNQSRELRRTHELAPGERIDRLTVCSGRRRRLD